MITPWKIVQKALNLPIMKFFIPCFLSTWNQWNQVWMDGWEMERSREVWLYSPMIDTTIVDEYGVAGYECCGYGTEMDLPITTLTQQYRYIHVYQQLPETGNPGYLFVKDMLGDELFSKACIIISVTGLVNTRYLISFSMNDGCGKTWTGSGSDGSFDDGCSAI